MNENILVINCGSSSIKFSLFSYIDNELILKQEGKLDNLGANTVFKNQSSEHIQFIEVPELSNHHDALSFLLNWLEEKTEHHNSLIIGHRVVHGGNKFRAPVLITDNIITELEKLISLAPLHQAHNLTAIKFFRNTDKNIKQVACFDTAFHAQHTKPVNQYAIPDEYYDAGIHRYGFHGLSYEYIVEQLSERDPILLKGKIIAAHLGNGASLCAINNGISIDSSMGFSALDGLMMGTRCGSIDPGVILYLSGERQMDNQQITDLLYKKSGLLGVSNISYNMKDLINSQSEKAIKAINLYIYRITKEIGALVSILKGLDGLIFTGGIGENEAVIREKVCAELNWLDLEINEQLNQKHNEIISTLASKIKVYVLNTNEELMIAKHSIQLVESR